MNRPVTNPDTTPPTRADELRRERVAPRRRSRPSWTAATDNVGVTEYRLYRDGVPAGTATTTAFTFTGLTCGTSANLEVEARDAVGNMSPRASLTAATDDCDVTPPSAPGTLTATGAIGRATLSWGAATDNVGVTRYNVHRGSTAGFTPSAANRIAQPTGTSYVDVTAAGTYYYRVTAEDAAGNVGAAVERGERDRHGRHDRSDRADEPHRDRRHPTGRAELGRRDRQRRRRALQRPPRQHARASRPRPRTGSRSRPGRATRIRTSRPGPTTTASPPRTRAGNVGPVSNEASATVTNPPPAGLVAGYGFDEGSGTSTADGVGPRQHRHALAARLDRSASSATPRTSTASTTGSRRRLVLARPDHRDDARGVGAAVDDCRLAHGPLQGAAERRRSTRSTRSTNTNVPRSEAVLGGTARSVERHRRAHDRVSGRTSRRATTAPPTGSSSTATRGTHGDIGQHHRHRPERSGSAATTSDGEFFSGQDRRGARLQPRADAGGDPDGHEPARHADFTPPTVAATTPAAGAVDVPIGVQPTARFNELIDPASVGAFELRDASNVLVPATVTLRRATPSTATLVPTAALTYGATYTAKVKGGPAGVKDPPATPLAADRSGASRPTRSRHRSS